jgi:Cu-Zn family superoxide dismutase
LAPRKSGGGDIAAESLLECSVMRKAVAGMIVLAGAMIALAAAAQDREPDLAADLVSIGGAAVGHIEIFAGPTGLLLRATFTGIEAGMHAFHIHQTGLCEAAPQVRPEDPPPFRSAGDHLNPDGREHGYLNQAGPHAGDLPNIAVPETGTLSLEMFAPGLDLPTLMDADGSSFIVHARADDYATDATGRSGGRIACGVIG